MAVDGTVSNRQMSAISPPTRPTLPPPLTPGLLLGTRDEDSKKIYWLLTSGVSFDTLYRSARGDSGANSIRYRQLVALKDVEYDAPNPMAALEGLGYRATAPRKAIARLLQQKPDTITLEALSEELPSVGTATVFRTIKLLLEAGLVCKLATIDGSQMYSLCRIGHHQHSVCVQCGAVEEFRAAAVQRLISATGAEVPGEVIDHRFELYVVCGSCPFHGGK